MSSLRTGTCLFLIKYHFDAGTLIDFCSTCKVRNNIYHLFLRCPQLVQHRLDILLHLNVNGLSHSLNSILNNNFPSDLRFKILKDVNYYSKV